MKNSLITIAVILALGLTRTYLYLKGKRYVVVVISQEQINEGLAKNFPYSLQRCRTRGSWNKSHKTPVHERGCEIRFFP